MSDDRSQVRQGEYAIRGDYHRQLDPRWPFYPTYLAKLAFVRKYLNRLPAETRVLDAGCGEGVIVEEFADHLSIEGIDSHYSSARVRTGSLLALPFPDESFDRVLCLDVLEHVPYSDQRLALREIRRVVKRRGEVLISVPNLAHLQSRIHFLLRGDLIRTADERKHPGDRPANEYLRMAIAEGFDIVSRRGIFPTVPLLTRLIHRHPATLLPLHRWLTRLLPAPGLCFLNLIVLRRDDERSPAV